MTSATARATTSRGGELGARVDGGQEASAPLVAQHGALAAHRLGDQEALRTGQGGGVELVELQVLELRAGAPGGGDAVPGGHGGVRGVGEELPGSAGGEHGGPGAYARPPPVVAEQLRAEHAPGAEQQVRQCRALTHEKTSGAVERARGLHDGPQQGPLDLGAGRVPAGVEDARPAVGALEPEGVGREAGRGAAPFAVEGDAVGDERIDRRRTLLAQQPHRLRLAEPCSRLHGVPGVQRGRVPRADGAGDPALRAGGRAVGQ